MILALPYRPDHIWMAGWGPLIEAIQKIEPEAVFDPKWGSTDYPVDFDRPLLTITRASDFLPIWPHLRSTVRNVAIAVPLECHLIKRYILNAHRYWDHVVVGSEWAREMILAAGYPNVTKIVHGPNPFFAQGPIESNLGERFTIFSGGKLELRKAQDVVIRAVGHMMQRRTDVHLITDWYNPWPETAASLWAAPGMPHKQNLYRFMRDCGIDLERTRHLHTEFATPEEHANDQLRAFRQSDVGLFPNRAESGPNSIMMNMMAAGRPVIALWAHGNRELLNSYDPLTCTQAGLLKINSPSGPASEWFEPDLDEVIAKLEWAYDEPRTQMWRIGFANSEGVRALTVDSVARQYRNLLIQ